MDRQKTIELLKQKSKEAVYVASLPYNNNEYLPWRRNSEDILESAFGITSTEYKRIADVHMTTKGTREEIQRTYVALVHRIQQEINSIIQKYETLGIEEKPTTTTKPTDTDESPIHLFDAMKFHPRIIKVSRKRFASGNYEDAIFRVFVEINNFVKEKADSDDDGKSLMSNTFNCKNPIIKLNALITQSDKDEQEGFMHLFMGAMQGIRNPKAHENLSPRDPLRTLEYLTLANLLMRRVEEGTAVKTSLPRTKWAWDRFLADTKSKCELEIVRLAVNLHEFARSNSDSISWGTGTQNGSFTFRKLGLRGMTSIFSMYSYGWVYINFSSMKNRNVPDSIMELFRVNLNKIPNINLPKEAVIEGKYARVHEKPLTRSENLKHFKDAVFSLCQQLENSKE